MGMLQEFENVHVKHVNGHYEAYRDRQFIVSGDTLKEIYEDLKELEYLR